MRSDYYYMIKRFVYLSVSTHTLIPSPYLLLYPLSVTRMLQLNRDQGKTLWLSRAHQHTSHSRGVSRSPIHSRSDSFVSVLWCLV